MTAYNPDPWTVYGMQDGTLTIQDGDGRILATFCSQDAKALHLMASAPELLRLLRVLVGVNYEQYPAAIAGAQWLIEELS